ncbi:MAG: threonine-phosphate decarboxylase [Deltaproteobacteria bacterium]|nr:threonine-phosphate decarboxylase [Deltaproteobacteria bacterium]TLN03336.1 MAG: threonine-phosphate decarboxylase [bacterium]
MTNNSDHGGTVFASARSLGIAPNELLDFSASINPLGPAPGVREAVCSSFEKVLHYPDRESFELRRALADVHRVGIDNLVVANGSTELIYLLPRLLPGTRGLIIAPAFSEYTQALNRAGWQTGHLLLSPDDGFALSLEKLAERLAEGFDLLFLCNPANPTGTLLPAAMIEEILRLCRRAGTFLVLDEAFMDFCEEASAKGLIAESGGGIVLRSMTKFYAIPGLRLGYAVGHPDIIGSCVESLEPWSVNTPAQVAGVASLASDGYRERTLGYVSAEREALGRGLAALPGLKPFPATANYLLVEMRSDLTAAELRSRLLEKRILIRDCANFEGLDSRFFRIAVRTTEENRRLLVALAEVLGE